MKRYVLFKKSGGEATKTELAEIVDNPGVTIIENDIRRLFLIEASAEALSEVEAALPGWTIGVETTHQWPERPREAIKSASGDAQTEE